MLYTIASNISNVLYSIYKVSIDKTYSYMYSGKDINVTRMKDKPLTESIYEHISAPLRCITHITDNIYLGNAYNAANYDELKQYDIKCIINATDEIGNYYDNNYEFTYMKLDGILDDSNSTIKKYFDDFLKFIKENKDHNILIHCFMGSSRSATLIVLYLIYFKNYTIVNAIKFVEEKCSRVNINIIYIKELEEYISVFS